MFLIGYSVAMVTTSGININLTCWPMIGHLFYTIIVTVTDKEWLYCRIKVEGIGNVENTYQYEPTKHNNFN